MNINEFNLREFLCSRCKGKSPNCNFCGGSGIDPYKKYNRRRTVYDLLQLALRLERYYLALVALQPANTPDFEDWIESLQPRKSSSVKSKEEFGKPSIRLS